MIQVAVVEDDSVHANQIQEYMDRYMREMNQKINVRFFSDGEDILENFKSVFDIIFMDIQMQFIDGMTAAKRIRELDDKVIIIFITSLANYAVKGYEVDALDFIVKPINYAIFAQKLTRAIKRLQKTDERFLVVATSDGARRVAVSQTYFIESSRHTMIYHTASGVIEARGRVLDDLEQELAPYGFFRSNKGYLVNMNYVDGIQDGACLIAGKQLLISRRKKAAFMEQLSKVL